jgi:D-3-phosphoglycerate dehydrogenase
VAAHALAMILSLCRRLQAADQLVRSGGWGIESLRPIRRISDLTFGLVGYGRIAPRVAASLETLGASVVVHDPYVAPTDGGPRLVTFDELVAASDVMSVHAPLTEATRGMFDRSVFDRVRPGAVFVNTSRGPLVVLEDLITSLRSGQLGGAGLDVFEREPADTELLDGVPNLLLTPHMAYYSEESLQESGRKAATQVVKALTGQPVDYPVSI